MSRHLREAIAINRQRKPLYARLSQGKTRSYSNLLISIERLALLSAFLFDQAGNRYERKGIPFIKSAFVEMEETPPFRERYPEGINFQEELIRLDLGPYKKQVKKGIRDRDFESIFKASQQVLKELEKQPHVYCMIRHLVESIRRIAWLYPIHLEQCHSKAINPPLNTTLWLLRGHLILLKMSQGFDEALAPIQNKGVPFLYQDLPHIGLDNPYDSD